MQPLPNIYLCCVFYDSMLVVHNNLPDLLWEQSGFGSRDLGSPARLCGLCAWVVWPMLHRCDSFMAAVHIGWQVLKRSAVPWQCYSWGWIEYDILSVRGRSKWKLLFVICDRIGDACEWSLRSHSSQANRICYCQVSHLAPAGAFPVLRVATRRSQFRRFPNNLIYNKQSMSILQRWDVSSGTVQGFYDLTFPQIEG